MLVTASASSARPQASPAELQALTSELDAAKRRYHEAYRQATTDEQRLAAIDLAPWAPFLERFDALAAAGAGADVGALASIRCLDLARSARDARAAYRALDRLEAEHMRSSALLDLPLELADPALPIAAARREATLRRLIVESPDRGVRGRAWFALGLALIDGRPSGEAAADPFAARKRLPWAREAFRRFLDEHADTPPPAGWPADSMPRRAKGFLFELDRLQVGMLAPEVSATDQDGRAFALADYRGRVVALEFWGSWCVPCVAHLPHRRALVERMAERPFAMLGVNSDGDPPSARPRIAACGVGWRQALDGNTFGAWASAWNVRAWPTLYVIDAEGVIRARDPSEADLDAIVEQWVARAEGAR